MWRSLRLRVAIKLAKGIMLSERRISFYVVDGSPLAHMRSACRHADSFETPRLFLPFKIPSLAILLKNSDGPGNVPLD